MTYKFSAQCKCIPQPDYEVEKDHAQALIDRRREKAEDGCLVWLWTEQGRRLRIEKQGLVTDPPEPSNPDLLPLWQALVKSSLREGCMGIAQTASVLVRHAMKLKFGYDEDRWPPDWVEIPITKEVFHKKLAHWRHDENAPDRPPGLVVKYVERGREGEFSGWTYKIIGQRWLEDFEKTAKRFKTLEEAEATRDDRLTASCKKVFYETTWVRIGQHRVEVLAYELVKGKAEKRSKLGLQAFAQERLNNIWAQLADHPRYKQIREALRFNPKWSIDVPLVRDD